MTYDAESFEARALAGDIMAASGVLSRPSLKPEVRSALMVDGAHDEIRIAVATRADVTPEELDWCSDCDNPFILNRLVSHPKTPTATLRAIRGRALGNTGEMRERLAEYSTRVLERLSSESGLHGAL
jgi:hypothetical protein